MNKYFADYGEESTLPIIDGRQVTRFMMLPNNMSGPRIALARTIVMVSPYSGFTWYKHPMIFAGTKLTKAEEKTMAAQLLLSTEW